MELSDLGASSRVLVRWEPVLEEIRIVQAQGARIFGSSIIVINSHERSFSFSFFFEVWRIPRSHPPIMVELFVRDRKHWYKPPALGVKFCICVGENLPRNHDPFIIKDFSNLVSSNRP